jgi:hypothetical protein
VEWPRHLYPDDGTVYLYSFHLTPWRIPVDHSWVKGGTAYADAVQYGHATPSRVVRPVAILIDAYGRVIYTYGPLFGLIMIAGLGGVVRLRRPRDGLPAPRLAWVPRLAWSPRAGSMLPWATAAVLLLFPIAVADFDYRYLLPVLPFACLAAGLAFVPARSPVLRVRTGRVDRQPPPAVGVTLPDSGVLGGELTPGPRAGRTVRRTGHRGPAAGTAGPRSARERSWPAPPRCKQRGRDGKPARSVDRS